MSAYVPQFPVGYHRLHRTKILDYQLNRWHSMGWLSLEEVREVGREVRGIADWQEVMLRARARAERAGRPLSAAFFVRAAEFFTHPEHPDKVALYDRFLAAFYGALADEPFTRHQVPYERGCLSALDIPAVGAPRGAIVLHGGFDSFLEELYSVARALSLRGYRVVLYDGPGQGSALKHHKLPMTPAWERSASAVLDHFGLDDVTWIGVSMGGWLCFRAAAFEPRIRRVVALGVAYDYMSIPPAWVAGFARWLFARPRLFDALAAVKMAALPQERWGARNLQYILQEGSLRSAGQAFLAFNADNLHSERVTQDVLILSGAEDHFIPLKLHRLQVAALSRARSVTDHVFTREQQAHNHCMVGNLGLFVETVGEWLARDELRAAG
ncbi:MAG: alpha/beta fold hydrolase [Myxococcales bacterium]|nr:alpha/beta fold hydrolase [Myxococcales bacterium]